MSKITISPIFHAKEKRERTVSRRKYITVSPKKYVNLHTLIKECLEFHEFDEFFALKNLKHDDNLMGFQHQRLAIGIMQHYKLVTYAESKKIIVLFKDRFEKYILKHNPALKRGHFPASDTPG